MKNFDTYKQIKSEGGFFKYELTLIQVEGEKAPSFLHGQFTNSIKDLANQTGNYNLFLTRKGKVLADFYVFRNDPHFFILVKPDLAFIIVEHLKKLAPLSKINLNSKSQTIYHHVLPKNQIELFHLKNENNSLIFRTDRLGIYGVDIFDNKPDALEINEECAEIIRVENGISKHGIDFDENNLPQESRLNQALHFKKGCYLGQEIIARLHFRGHVNKILVGLAFDSNKKLEINTAVYLENEPNKSRGEIRSCVYSPKLNRYLALAYVPYDNQEVGNSFLIGDEKIKGEIVGYPL